MYESEQEVNVGYRTGIVICLRNSRCRTTSVTCSRVILLLLLLLLLDLWGQVHLVVAAGRDLSLTGSPTAMVELAVADYVQQNQEWEDRHRTRLATNSGCHLLNSRQWRFETSSHVYWRYNITEKLS